MAKKPRKHKQAVQPGGLMKPAPQPRHRRAPHPHPAPLIRTPPPRKQAIQPGGTMKRAKRHPKRHLAGPSRNGWWITGGNDIADNCAAVAVANSLLLSSGLRVSDGELLRLHDRAGALSVPEALAALGARAFGEAPCGLVAGLATPYGPHAALVLGDALVSWGGLIPWPDDWLLEELWAVTW